MFVVIVCRFVFVIWEEEEDIFQRIGEERILQKKVIRIDLLFYLFDFMPLIYAEAEHVNYACLQ